MTTISIKNAKGFSRTDFKDIADLQDYLLSLQLEREFSEDFIEDLNQREKDILSNKVQTISWEKVSAKLDV